MDGRSLTDGSLGKYSSAAPQLLSDIVPALAYECAIEHHPAMRVGMLLLMHSCGIEQNTSSGARYSVRMCRTCVTSYTWNYNLYSPLGIYLKCHYLPL